MIKMNENTIGLWFVSGKVGEQEQDWLAHLGYELIDDKKTLVLTYRFRYYNKDTGDPFEDDDKKNWYRCVSKEAGSDPLDIIMGTIRGIAKIIQVRMGAEDFDQILVKDFPSFDAFMTYFMDRPWSFVKLATKEEAAAYLQKSEK